MFTHPSLSPDEHAASVARRGFTLVELLVVIGVIGILMAVVLTVGARVAQGGKVRLTEQTIRTLDLVLEAVISDTGSLPAAVVADPRSTDPTNRAMLPIADARDFTFSASAGQPGQPAKAGHQIINSVGLFLLLAERVPAAASALRGIDSKLIQRWDGDHSDELFSSQPGTQPTIPTVFDAWNRPLRFVHPQFDGLIYGPDYLQGQVTSPAESVRLADLIGPASASMWYPIERIRRNAEATAIGPAADREADSDGGTCPSNSPYFYSAGPDGDPSATQDNVYTTTPVLPKAQ